MRREHDPVLDRVRRQLPPSTDAFERLERRREAKAMRSRIVAGTVGLSVTAALVAGLILSGSLSSGSDAGESVPGSDGSTPAVWTMPTGLAIPDGSFAYVHVVEYRGKGQAGFPADQQTWFSPSDGSGRFTASGVASDPLLDGGPQTQGPYSHDDSYGPGEMGNGEQWLGLDDLSTDPAVLAEQLAEPYRSAGATPGSSASPNPNVDGSVADIADIVLSTANTATPELKAALSQVLAGLEGATVDSATSDPVGRLAWSVRLTQGARVETWWFDPQSDQLLASVVVDTNTYFRIYEAAGVVDGTGDRSPQPAFIPPTTDVPPGAKA